MGVGGGGQGGGVESLPDIPETTPPLRVSLMYFRSPLAAEGSPKIKYCPQKGKNVISEDFFPASGGQ